MKVLVLLQSKKLALVLICFLILYCFIGVINSAGGQLVDNPFFYQWPMQMLLGALLVNTLACTVGQAFKTWRFYRRLGLANEPLQWKIAVSKNNEEEARRWLARSGYKPVGKQVWSRRAYALTFIVIFHASFIVIGLGVLWSQYFRVEALVPVTSGEEVQLHSDAYSLYNPAKYGSLETGDWLLKLNNVKVIYPKQGWPQEVSADLQLWEGGRLVLSETLKKVPPQRHKNVEFYVWDFGFAPLILLEQNGLPVLEGYVSLLTDEINGRTVSKDHLPLPDGRKLNLEFLPRGLELDWGDPAKYMYPLNPHLSVSLEGGENKLTLAQGERGQLGPYTIGFPDYRYMVMVKVIKDRGMDIIFLAFWLAALSLTAHFLMTPSFASISTVDGRWNIHIYEKTLYNRRSAKNEH